jgi:hypothetical protein
MDEPAPRTPHSAATHPPTGWLGRSVYGWSSFVPGAPSWPPTASGDRSRFVLAVADTAQEQRARAPHPRNDQRRTTSGARAHRWAGPDGARVPATWCGSSTPMAPRGTDARATRSTAWPLCPPAPPSPAAAPATRLKRWSGSRSRSRSAPTAGPAVPTRSPTRTRPAAWPVLPVPHRSRTSSPHHPQTTSDADGSLGAPRTHRRAVSSAGAVIPVKTGERYPRRLTDTGDLPVLSAGRRG